jgi:hypothetical protein
MAWPNAVLAAVVSVQYALTGITDAALQVTLGALVIRAPYSSLAGVAYQELQSGCEILQNFFDSSNFLLVRKST